LLGQGGKLIVETAQRSIELVELAVCLADGALGSTQRIRCLASRFLRGGKVALEACDLGAKFLELVAGRASSDRRGKLQ